MYHPALTTTCRAAKTTTGPLLHELPAASGAAPTSTSCAATRGFGDAPPMAALMVLRVRVFAVLSKSSPSLHVTHREPDGLGASCCRHNSLALLAARHPVAGPILALLCYSCLGIQNGKRH